MVSDHQGHQLSQEESELAQITSPQKQQYQSTLALSARTICNVRRHFVLLRNRVHVIRPHWSALPGHLSSTSQTYNHIRLWSSSNSSVACSSCLEDHQPAVAEAVLSSSGSGALVVRG